MVIPDVILMIVAQVFTYTEIVKSFLKARGWEGDAYKAVVQSVSVVLGIGLYFLNPSVDAAVVELLGSNTPYLLRLLTIGTAFGFGSKFVALLWGLGNSVKDVGKSVVINAQANAASTGLNVSARNQAKATLPKG